MARALTAAGCLALLAAGSAGAADWQGDRGSGRLEFTATQAGARFSGGFERFQVRLSLDPAAPEAGRLQVTVATASADTQDADRDGILESRDFFWSERHPEAVYQALGFERDGEGYRARGTLALRGVTLPVTVRFTAQPGGERLAMKGDARLSRLAFGVGQGDWADTEWVGDEVAIAFELSLRAAPAGTSP